MSYETPTITDEQLNIAICEWRGWHPTPNGQWTQSPTGIPNQEHWIVPSLPSHITGIEALGNMHACELKLLATQRDDYQQQLYRECEKAHRMAPIYWLAITATARQRAIALLRVVKPEFFQ